MSLKRDTAGQRRLPRTRPAAQQNRHRLFVCVTCGYKIRVTGRWAMNGLPRCHCGGEFAAEKGGGL